MTTHKESLICHCAGVTEIKLKELIAKGKDSLAKIANFTGATTGCAGCECDITELLDQELKLRNDDVT